MQSELDEVGAAAAEMDAAAAAIAAATAEMLEAKRLSKEQSSSAAATEAADSVDALDLKEVDVDLFLSLNDVDAAYLEGEADGIFDAIDRDQNGFITPSELREHLQAAQLGFVVDHERIVTFLDANEDGLISRAEMRAGLKRYESATLRLALGLGSDPRRGQQEGAASLQPNGREKLADEVFEKIDADSNGVISISELEQYLQRMGYAQTTVETIFNALDLNSDGELSREELRAGLGRFQYSALRLALGIK